MANFVALSPDDLEKLSIPELENYVAQEQAASSERGLAAPSTAQDIKTGALPWAVQSGVSNITSFGPGILDLGLTGVQKGAEAAGAGGIQNWAQTVRQQLEPTSYAGQMRQLQQKFPNANLGYQPQTSGGGYTQSALQYSPAVISAALSGGESVLPAAAKGLAASAGAETAKQYAPEWSQPWSQMAAALAGWGTPAGMRRAITPNPAMPERNAFANTLANAGVPVSAADRSGSRFWASMEGSPPAGQMEKLSDVMMKENQSARPAGSYASTRELVWQREQELKQTANQLEATSVLPVNPQLQQGLQQIVAKHAADFGGTSKENPAIQGALDDFNAMSQAGNGQLAGTQYAKLSRDWKGSGVPELLNMGKQLDAAMAQTPFGPAWNQYRQAFASNEGMKAGSRAAGGKATTGPVNPSVVNRTIGMNTPVKRIAEAGEGIFGTRPEPYSWGELGASGAGLSLAGGLAGLIHGHSEPWTAGIFGAMEAPAAAAMMGKALQPVVRSGPMQKYLSNQALLPPSYKGMPPSYTSLDPQTAARLLALKGVTPAQSVVAIPPQPPQ